MGDTSAIAIIKAICYCLFITFGMAGNTLVCVSIWKRKKLRTLPNYLVFSLAVSDWLFCITVTPFLLITAIADEWILGYTMCQITGFLTTFFCVVSISTLVLISVNRYFAVGRPKQYSSIFTARRIFICVAIIWFIGVVVSAPPLLGWSRFRAGDNFCTIDGREDISYAGFIILVGYLIPLICLTFLYSRIFFILRSHSRVMKKLRKHGSQGKDYDDYSSSDMGSLRRRVSSKVPINEIGGPKGSPMKEGVKSVEDIANGGAVPGSSPKDTRSIEDGMPDVVQYRRSHSSDDIDKYNYCDDDTKEERRRSTSLHLAQPLTSSKATSVNDVDVQGLVVYRNKLYVNNVSIVDDPTSATRPSSTSASRDSGLNGSQEIGRGTGTRSSNKLSSLANTLRKKVRPNLRKMSKEAKITRMLFTVVITFFICWTPVVVGSVLYAYRIRVGDFDQLSFGFMIACLNSVCNPIIYAFMNTQFRKAFVEIGGQWCRYIKCK